MDLLSSNQGGQFSVITGGQFSVVTTTHGQLAGLFPFPRLKVPAAEPVLVWSMVCSGISDNRLPWEWPKRCRLPFCQHARKAKLLPGSLLFSQVEDLRNFFLKFNDDLGLFELLLQFPVLPLQLGNLFCQRIDFFAFSSRNMSMKMRHLI